MIKADIGVIGGSGFYSLFTNAQLVRVKTPYGMPSSQYAISEIAGKHVAFLPRHGERHQYPPHSIPYRANIFGFKKLGVKFIIAPCAAGSLQSDFAPGNFVLCDQLVDRTHERRDTFYDGPKTVHVVADQPFCPTLRKIGSDVGRRLGYHIHKEGTVVVINGPRFSTKAESEWYKRQHWQVINMTVYPEVILARELELCYVNISLITDYDTGIKDDSRIKPVSLRKVLEVFKENNARVKMMIEEMIKIIDVDYACRCHNALMGATFQ